MITKYKGKVESDAFSFFLFKKKLILVVALNLNISSNSSEMMGCSNLAMNVCDLIASNSTVFHLKT